MTGTDWVLLAIIGAGGLLGGRRGGIAGMLDIVSLVTGFVAAIVAASWIDDRLIGFGIEQRWLLVGSSIVVFGAVTGISGFVLRLIASPLGLATKVPPFGLLDSLLGIAPGAVKGGLLSVLAVLVVMIQFPDSEAAVRIQSSNIGELTADLGSRGYEWAADLAKVDVSGLTVAQVEPGQTWAGIAPLQRGAVEPDAAGEIEAIGLVNAARNARNLPSLEHRGELAAVARAHAADIRPTSEGGLPASAADVGDRLVSAGVRCLAAGAVVGFGESVEAAIAEMLRSPDHRDVLLSRTYLWAGFGVLTRADGNVIVVGVFTL